MQLSSETIANKLAQDVAAVDDPMVIVPQPDIEELKSSGGASVDLRLGTWFMSMKARQMALLDIYREQEQRAQESSYSSNYHVPFGDKFILHPKSFILAVTLEWLRIPLDMSAMVTGKSSWGRRGLVVETAPGVHPGFVGCLTLELTNLGEIPIAISPGTKICQLFISKLDSPRNEATPSRYFGQRRPLPSTIKPDSFAKNLMSHDDSG